jgi:hypothetical protein
VAHWPGTYRQHRRGGRRQLDQRLTDRWPPTAISTGGWAAPI